MSPGIKTYVLCLLKETPGGSIEEKCFHCKRACYHASDSTGLGEYICQECASDFAEEYRKKYKKLPIIALTDKAFELAKEELRPRVAG